MTIRGHRDSPRYEANAISGEIVQFGRFSKSMYEAKLSCMDRLMSKYADHPNSEMGAHLERLATEIEDMERWL